MSISLNDILLLLLTFAQNVIAFQPLLIVRGLIGKWRGPAVVLRVY